MRGPQGLLAGQRGAAAAGEQAEGVVQPLGQLLGAEHVHPARRPSRCASGMPSSRWQMRASAAALCAGHLVVGQHQPRPVDEQPAPRCNSFRSSRPAGGRGRGTAATARGRPPRPQCPAARGWWPGCSGRGQACSSVSASWAQASSRCSQLSSTSSTWRPRRKAASAVQDRPPGLVAHAQAAATCCGHQRRVGQRRQLHQPDAVGEIVQQRLGHLQRQAGLAHPARAGERHQAVVGQARA